MSRRKISLIGAGNVGGTLAHLILLKNFGDIILFDIIDGLPQGKALDLSQCTSIIGHDIKILGTNKYEDIKNSDLIIVSAGIARKPGMSRDDLLEINSYVMKTVGEKIKLYSPNAFIICLTNPSNVMINILQEYSAIRDNKIVGMAGVLALGRFKTQLASFFNISVNDVNAFILGSHDDSMIPLTELSSIFGITLTNLIKAKKITQNDLNLIIDKTKKSGSEIVSLLKGSAYYAPASAAIAIAEAYLLDKKKILPCVVKLTQGEYSSTEPIFFSVPAKIGSKGVEDIIKQPLTTDEKKKLEYCFIYVSELNNIWKNIKSNFKT